MTMTIHTRLHESCYLTPSRRRKSFGIKHTHTVIVPSVNTNYTTLIISCTYTCDNYNISVKTKITNVSTLV